MSKAWKGKEALVASWFNTRRNPLSGRNNVNDDGTNRLGDIIYRDAVVEVKSRNTVSMVHAKNVRALAKAHKKPWLLVEFCPGEAELVKFTMNYLTARELCSTLIGLWQHMSKEAKEYGLARDKQIRISVS